MEKDTERVDGGGMEQDGWMDGYTFVLMSSASLATADYVRGEHSFAAASQRAPNWLTASLY